MEFITSETNEIAKALSAFQKEVKQPKKDADNPHFRSKYVPLKSVEEVIQKTATKYGLSYTTYPIVDAEKNTVGVGVVILHESGQRIQLPPVIMSLSKGLTPQHVGAAITYGRRYSLGMAFGISSETEDDANSIEPQQPKQQPKYVTQHAETKLDETEPTKEQEEILQKEVLDMIDYFVNQGISFENVEKGLKKYGKTDDVNTLTLTKKKAILDHMKRQLENRK